MPIKAAVFPQSSLSKFFLVHAAVFSLSLSAMEYQWHIFDYHTTNGKKEIKSEAQSSYWFDSEEAARKNLRLFEEYWDSPDCWGTEIVINKQRKETKDPKVRFRWVLTDYNAADQVMSELVSQYWFKTEEDAKVNAEYLATYKPNRQGYNRQIRCEQISNFYCQLCDRKFSGEFYLNSHLGGRPHADKLKAGKQSPPATAPKPCLIFWYCGECNKQNKQWRRVEPDASVVISLPLCPDCDKLNFQVAAALK